jgi:hypothetical protein
MDEHGENNNATELHGEPEAHMDETIGTNTANTGEKAVGSQVYDPQEWSSAPLRDPKTGRWIKGTGGSLKGGRPVGARDKITNQMIRLAEETAAEYGEEMFRRLAKDDPAACLALITRLLPNSDLSKAIEGESEGGNEITQVNISITPSPTQRLPDARTQEQVDAQQRGLARPVERLEAPLDDVVEEVAQAPSEPRKHKAPASGIPGYKRGQKSDTAVYWDEETEEDRDHLRDLYSSDEYL